MRLALMGGLGLVLAFFFAFMVSRLTSGDLELLYSDLDPAEAGGTTGWRQVTRKWRKSHD